MMYLHFVLLWLLVGYSDAGHSAEVYKWVDKDGNVHYSDSPPSDVITEEIKPPPAPSNDNIRRTQARTDLLIEQQRASADQRAQVREETKRLPDMFACCGGLVSGPRDLRLPDTVSSKYLRGKGTGWHVDIEKFEVTPNISFQVSEEVRRDGVYVEARFPNPGRGADFYHGAHAQRGERLFLTGEPSVNYECGTPYVIQVRVYRTRLKLGIIDKLSQPSIMPFLICELAGDAASSENP